MGTNIGAGCCSGSRSGVGSDTVMGWIVVGGAGAGVLLPEMRVRKCSMACNSSGGALLAPWIAVAKYCVALTILSMGETVGVLIA